MVTVGTLAFGDDEIVRRVWRHVQIQDAIGGDEKSGVDLPPPVEACHVNDLFAG